MRVDLRRAFGRPIAAVVSAATLVACGDAPTSTASAISVPKTSDVSLRIVDVGMPTIAAQLTNSGSETLALAGCVSIEEGRSDGWVPVTPEGCALVGLFVLPAQSLRLAVPASLASSPVRVRVRVQTLRSDGQRSLGTLEVVASTR